MSTILVPEALGQQVLSGIRTLYYQGDSVDLAHSMNQYQRKLFKSKALRNIIPISQAKTNENQFVNELLDICKKNKYDIMMPFALSSYYIIAKYLNLFNSHIAFMVPEYELFNFANDKEKMTEYCKSIGIHVPKIYNVNTESDLTAISNEVMFPVVVKAISGTGVDRSLRYANNAEELKKVYIELASQKPRIGFDFEKPFVQEFIPGYIHDACTLTQHGNV